MAIGKVYGSALTVAWSGGINFASDTIKCTLHTATHVPDQDADVYFSDTSNEATGAGYTAGGVTVTGKTVTYNTTTNTLTLDCNNPAWSSATLSNIRYAIFWKDTGNPATSPLLCYMDFETPQAVTGANVTVVIPTTGLLQCTAA